MAMVTFLWHLHQPAYRTADGTAHAPWVIMHAGGSYTTLARAIIETEGAGQVVNIVPTLLEQLTAYAEGRVDDPVLEALIRPATALSDAERVLLVDWAFHVPARQLSRYPRLQELNSRRSTVRQPDRLSSFFGPGDLRDLQVLFILATAGSQAWTDPRLKTIYPKGRHFSVDDHRLVAEWLSCQPGELLQLWQKLAALPGVEIATSPWAHPIMPLLVSSDIVTDSWAPHPAPKVPEFSFIDDARWQLEQGLATVRAGGFDPVGCWPPEGSVSEQAVALYAEQDIRWLVSDEGILERSLGRPIRSREGVNIELYRPWQLESASTRLFFRDRLLSDRIGFVYGHWEDEEKAARDMVSHLQGIARSLPQDAAIVVALDGENPWLHYAEAGGRFLTELMIQLRQTGDDLEPATLAQICDRLQPQALKRLHPGSWIGGTFATWIGHPEKTQAWEVLAQVRKSIVASSTPQPPSLALAEGSDWFWWLGDDNPTPLAPLYDQIFRTHLADACRQAGVTPPLDLDKPLKTITHPLRIPLSSSWQSPQLDGRVTSYFEWSIAAWVEAEEPQPLRHLALWASPHHLHLMVQGTQNISQLVSHSPLTIHLTLANGEGQSIVISEDACDCAGVACGIDQIAELSIPWDPRPGARLEVRLGQYSLPVDAVLALEPFAVDEPGRRTATGSP